MIVWIARKLGVAACMIAICGCATALTQARITQTDADGFTESVSFRTVGIVTWGSSQELQRGDLEYAWGESEHFRAGGSASDQRSKDPATDVLLRVVDILATRTNTVE